MGVCSIGMGIVDLRAKIYLPLADAIQARRNAFAQGGNRFETIDRSDEDTRSKLATQFGATH